MIFYHRNRLINRKFKDLTFEPSCRLIITFEPVEGAPDEYIVLNREELISIINSVLELST